MSMQEQEAVRCRGLHTELAGLLIPASSPDSCAMAERICTLSWLHKSVQVTTYQQRVNHGNMPFSSPPYSALQSTSASCKFEAFSDNCYQPCAYNSSDFSVIPAYSALQSPTQPFQPSQLVQPAHTIGTVAFTSDSTVQQQQAQMESVGWNNNATTITTIQPVSFIVQDYSTS